jgi:prepilin-type N-terminal cleavage/methylation domain-containing protein
MPIAHHGPEPDNRLSCRRGYTLVESAIVIVIFSLLTAAMLPRVSPTVMRVSATRAANVIAQDLEQGFTLAQRQQQPVVLTAVPAQQGYTVTDRASGTVLSRRSFALGNGLAMDSVQVEPSTTTIYPNGYASSAVAVTLWNRGSARTITASRTGLVRIQ